MKTVNERLIFLLNEIFKGNVSEFARVTGVPQPTLNNIVGNRMSKPSSDNLERIINSIESIDANWLITGKGEMYKNIVAGRDNVGTGNKVSGENSGVIGNTGTIGNVGVKNMSIGEPGLIKKIIDKDGLSLEFSESVEILHRTNAFMEIRIKDLETINALQAKTIETMQMLIDTLTKK